MIQHLYTDGTLKEFEELKSQFRLNNAHIFWYNQLKMADKSTINREILQITHNTFIDWLRYNVGKEREVVGIYDRIRCVKGEIKTLKNKWDKRGFVMELNNGRWC